MEKELHRTKRKPLLSRVPAAFVAAVLKGHSGLGLAFAAAIYIVCLTGALVVFHDELLWWEAAGAPELTTVAPQAVQAAIEGAIARGGAGVEHVYATLPSADNPHLRLYVDADVDSNWAADASGTITGSLHTPWTEFVTGLHIHLHLPQTWGVFVVGMTGVALLSSLISGILAHPRILRDAFHLRLGGSPRLQEADLHNRIGVWGLPFHFVVSLSGAFLGLVTITVGVLGMAMFNGDTGKIYELFLPPEPLDNPAPAPVLDVASVFGKAPTDSRLERIVIEHPLEQGATALFEYRDDSVMAGEEHYAFNRADQLYYSKVVQQSATGEQILGSLGPLHFGWFGGLPIKLAYVALGFGLTYLSVGGVNIWLARRRDKGRPAPRWERFWAACVWSQPLALAVLALVALAWLDIGGAVMIGLWLALSSVALLSALVLDAKTIRGLGRGLTGTAMVIVAGWHSILLAPGSLQWTLWIIDLVLGLSGAGLLLFSLRRARSKAGQQLVVASKE